MSKKGYTDLSELLRIYGEDVAQAAREAVIANAELLAAKARSLCPSKSGKLKASIHVEILGDGVKNENMGSKVAKVVVDAKDAKGRYYGRVVEFSPTRGHPFLLPAYYAYRDQMKQNIFDAIDKVRVKK